LSTNSNTPARKLRFTKMHGAGNDFIVLNGIDQDLSNITQEQWQKLSHRQFGIGADQILLVEKATRPDADFRYRIFNADGGEVEQCGNGSRCFVRFVLDQGLSNKNPLRVEVAHTVLTLLSHPDGQVEVNMGAPIFEHSQIPFKADGLASMQEFHEMLYALPLDRPASHDDWVGVVSMGNPHAVQVVGDVDSAPVLEEGPYLRNILHSQNVSMRATCKSSIARKSNSVYLSVAPEKRLPAERELVLQWFRGFVAVCSTLRCKYILAAVIYKSPGAEW